MRSSINASDISVHVKVFLVIRPVSHLALALQRAVLLIFIVIESSFLINFEYLAITSVCVYLI